MVKKMLESMVRSLDRASSSAFEVQHLTKLTAEEKTELVRIGGAIADLVNRGNKMIKALERFDESGVSIPRVPQPRSLFSWNEHEKQNSPRARRLRETLKNLEQELEELEELGTKEVER